MKIRGLEYGIAAIAVVALGVATRSPAQQDLSKVQIIPQRVAEGIYMVTGAGGNIGLSGVRQGVHEAGPVRGRGVRRSEPEEGER